MPGLEFETLYINDLDRGPYISETLRLDGAATQLEAQIEIYRMMRPRRAAHRRKRRKTCSKVCFSRRKDMTCPPSDA